MDDKLLEAAARLVTAVVNSFGPWGTIAIMAALLIALGVRRVYHDRRADKDRNEALQEKERTIQRLASEVRQWKIYAFMQVHGMTMNEAERLFAENDFRDPAAARAALESRARQKTPGKGKG